MFQLQTRFGSLPVNCDGTGHMSSRVERSPCFRCRRYREARYIVIDLDTIDRRGAADMDELLGNHLVVNASRFANVTRGAISGGNTNNVDIRGAGADQTLALIDGGRAPASAQFGESIQPDINSISLASTEKIEVDFTGRPRVDEPASGAIAEYVSRQA